ncbi:MAG: amidohydrolase family protein [Planctomycetota bacterium]|nr:amidohydrolase family protein [Planctomycetota bacterium]MDA1137696.1 amidohydrolase family protein [Planctomycetota bacterium]
MSLFFDAYTCFGPRPKTHGKHPWSFQHLLDELDHCSISGALVATTAQTLYDAEFENRRLSEKLAEFEHLFPIWNVIPHWTNEFPEPSELIRQMKGHDVRAVQIHPKTNGYPVTSDYTAPLLNELEKHQILTIVEYSQIDASDLESVLKQFPKLPVLLRGQTWSQQRTILPLVLNHQNLHVCFTHMQANLTLEWLVGKGCVDQLLFASNAPEMSAGAHRVYIDWSEISEEHKEKVASGNLIRLLRGQKPPKERSNLSEDEIMTAAREGRPLPCLTIDMHVHMLDEGLNGAGGSYTMFDGGPIGVRRLAERMGVDRMGIMSWNGVVGVHAQQGNQCLKDAIDACPDFYWGLGTFDVMHETPETMRRQMEDLYSDGRFLGLKPYPQYGIPYSDPRYDCWWEFGQERGLYAVFHPVNWYQPGEFASVCERFPGLTVVAYHSGASYEAADVVISLAKQFKNFMFEPTLTPVCGGIIDYLVEGAGEDRGMYGSDLPMRDPRQQLGWIVFSRLPLEAKKKVLGGNALRLMQRVSGNDSFMS